MNFSSSTQSNDFALQMIHSLQDWWALAGVDHDYHGEPRSLLNEPTPTHEHRISPQSDLQSLPTVTARQGHAAPGIAAAPSDKPSYPEDLVNFRQWLAQPANLLENGWSRDLVLPVGDAEPEIMIVTAIPEKNPNMADSLFNEQDQTLLAKMLAALQCDSQQVYMAPLSCKRPGDGMIEPVHRLPLKERMLHQIRLVQPKRVIFFGDLLSKIFFDQDLLTARKKKQNINHNGSETEAIVTFHPRTLIQRPQFKAEAWQDLQLLTRISAR